MPRFSNGPVEIDYLDEGEGEPVVLVHGENDSESPPEIATRLQALIPGARLHMLRGFDHWSILTDGRHQVTHLLVELLESLE